MGIYTTPTLPTKITFVYPQHAPLHYKKVVVIAASLGDFKGNFSY